MEFLSGKISRMLSSLFVAGCLLFASSSFAAEPTRSSIFAKSYEYESNKQYDQAIEVLKEVKADIYAVNLRLGWLYYCKGNYRVSIMYYSKAIQLRPTSLEARFGYVLPAAKMKDWIKVGKQYDAILKLDPNNTKANYYRGLMYFNVGEYAKAEPYFDKVEHLYPFDYDIVILSAWNSYYLKNKEKAKLLFNQALLIQPSSASAAEGLSLTK